MSVVPDYCEVLTGWRAWVAQDALGLNGVRLYPLTCSFFVEPRKIVAARCEGTEQTECPHCGNGLHVAPVAGCACGYWAFKTREDLEGSGFRDKNVFGRVALWGKVVEHDKGWRAQFMYPVELFAAKEFMAGLEVYGVPVRPLSEGPKFPPVKEPLTFAGLHKFISTRPMTPDYFFGFTGFKDHSGEPMPTWTRFGGSYGVISSISPLEVDHETLLVEPTKAELAQYGTDRLMQASGPSLVDTARRLLRSGR